MQMSIHSISSAIINIYQDFQRTTVLELTVRNEKSINVTLFKGSFHSD